MYVVLIIMAPPVGGGRASSGITLSGVGVMKRFKVRWRSGVRTPSTAAAAVVSSSSAEGLTKMTSSDITDHLVEGRLDDRLKINGKSFDDRKKKIDWDGLEIAMSLAGVGSMLALIMVLYNTDIQKASAIYKQFKIHLSNTYGLQPPPAAAGGGGPTYINIDEGPLQPEDIQPLSQAGEVLIRQITPKDSLYTRPGDESSIMIFSGSASMQIARDVCAHLNIALSRMKLTRFEDGEILLDILDDVRSRDVYVFQSVSQGGTDLHSHLMELFLTVSALRRASAERITAVLPYFAYSTHDETVTAATPLAASDVSRLLYTSGVDRVVFVDHHAARAASYFPEPLPSTNIRPHRLAIKYLAGKNLCNPVIVSPERGSGESAKFFWTLYKKVDPGVGLATLVNNKPFDLPWSKNFTKKAIEPVSRELDEEKSNYFVGSVKDRDCIILDDIVNTGVKVTNAVRACKAQGARRVFVCVTHGLLSKGALSRLSRCEAEEIVTTNTIELPSTGLTQKIKVLNISSLITQVIRRLHSDVSGDHVEELGNIYKDYEHDQNLMQTAHQQ